MHHRLISKANFIIPAIRNVHLHSASGADIRTIQDFYKCRFRKREVNLSADPTHAEHKLVPPDQCYRAPFVQKHPPQNVFPMLSL